jgi:F0F1-type ATP synthase epsilon subunit
MRLRVLTPAETLLEVEQTKWVQVRLSDGTGLSIYPGHAPLLAETVTAPLRYADETGERMLDVEAGIVQVENHDVSVFTRGEAEVAEAAEPLAVARERKFERLARELQDRLRREEEVLLENGLEEI